MGLSLWSPVKFKIYERRRGFSSEGDVVLQIREQHEREICKTEQYKIMNNLETNDLSWQEWSEDEGITVIASQAPLSEIPWPHIWADLGGGGVYCSCGLWLLRLYDALLYTALCFHTTQPLQLNCSHKDEPRRGTENNMSQSKTRRFSFGSNWTVSSD